jgi:peptidoglycan/LPS O-acetylase OafA/YrhL
VPPGLIGLFLAMVLASSVALYHLVERPAQKWVNGIKILPVYGEGDQDAQRLGGGGPPTGYGVVESPLHHSLRERSPSP